MVLRGIVPCPSDTLTEGHSESPNITVLNRITVLNTIPVLNSITFLIIYYLLRILLSYT